jgi:hypothetical protein
MISMSDTNTEQIMGAMAELYTAHRPFLPPYAWEWESYRWEELVVCLLNEGLGIDSRLAREAVILLRQLRVTSVSALGDSSDEDEQFIQNVLSRLGVDQDVATRAASLLVSVAMTVNDRWEGYIQRFLRGYGQKMVEELRDVLIGDGLELRQATKVATLWLQNAVNMPILFSDDEYVQSFCSEMGISEQKLQDIADQAGINVAVLDDLLAFKKQYQEANSHNV